jgi:hypothetical protein
MIRPIENCPFETILILTFSVIFYYYKMPPRPPILNFEFFEFQQIDPKDPQKFE